MRCRCGYGLCRGANRAGWVRPPVTTRHGRRIARKLSSCAAEVCTQFVVMARSFASLFKLADALKDQHGHLTEKGYGSPLTPANTAVNLCGRCQLMEAAYTRYLQMERLPAKRRETGPQTGNTSFFPAANDTTVTCGLCGMLGAVFGVPTTALFH